MALTISTTLAAALAAATATAHGTNTVLEIRSGSKPANADAAASGTLLCSVTIAGAWTATGNAISAADPAAANPARRTPKAKPAVAPRATGTRPAAPRWHSFLPGMFR